MKSIIQKIDIVNYAAMAERMFPASHGLALCDSAGNVLSGSSEQFCASMAAFGTSQPEWFNEVNDIARIDFDRDSFLLIMDLSSVNEPAFGFLCWCVATQPATYKSADMHDTLLSLGSCIRTEVRLQTELDSMALELSERYEELNLVYHTDDEVNFFHEGREALKSLVDNCADYLDSTFAAIYLPEKKLFVASSSSLDEGELRLLKSVLIGRGIYDSIVAGANVAFINNDAEPVEFKQLPYRIMATRVIVFGEQIEGALLIGNHLSHRCFSNSDKNLMCVMSRKVAKIIQSSYDGLTGMLNRFSFDSLASSEMERIRTIGGRHVMLFINIDRLHRVNETIGHEAGDMVIRSVARQLERELRESDIVARIGGDEFGVLIQNCSTAQAKSIAGKLSASVTGLEMEWNGEPLNVTVSIGIAEAGDDVASAEEVLKRAAMACDQATEAGGNGVHTFELEDTGLREREANMWMVSTVHAALRDDAFILYGQTIEPLRPGEPHVEVLLRMRDGDKIVAPQAFLPASERYQLMHEIDRWVVQHAFETIRSCIDSGPTVVPVFGINLSGQSFANADFLAYTLKKITETGIPTDRICFEITETAAVANMNKAQQFIDACRKIGCQFALDDFGAGLSSFGYLKSFDVQYLKIDGALVKNLDSDPINHAMVESVNQIGHVMGLKTIAEFVETPGERAALARIGVDYAQGYLLGRPIPLTEQLALMGAESAAAGA